MWLNFKQWYRERNFICREFLVAETSTWAIVMLVLAVLRKLIRLALSGHLNMNIATRIMVAACVSSLERHQE